MNLSWRLTVLVLHNKRNPAVWFCKISLVCTEVLFIVTAQCNTANQDKFLLWQFRMLFPSTVHHQFYCTWQTEWQDCGLLVLGCSLFTKISLSYCTLPVIKAKVNLFRSWFCFVLFDYCRGWRFCWMKWRTWWLLPFTDATRMTAEWAAYATALKGNTLSFSVFKCLKGQKQPIFTEKEWAKQKNGLLM